MESKDVAITITTPKNTKLQSVTLTYKIYDNVGNESTKAETLHTYIDKVEKQTSSCSGCGCSNNSNGGGSSSSERPCKGWGGLACVIEGAFVGGTGGMIVGAVATPIGSAAGAVGGFIGGAVTGLLCWIFC